jgi:ADP-ribose pyrophosphatase YjhB (NUDIX family)
MSNTKLFVAVKACILNENNEVLLLRESHEYKDSTNLLQYDVPGGRIEVTESLHDGLSREVLEETGLKVLSSELIDAHDTFNIKGDEQWHIVRLFYKVTCEEREITLSIDHDEYKWVPLRDISTFRGIIENLIPTLKKIEASEKR